MNDTAKNIITISLPVFGIGVIVYLLWFGKIEPSHFTFLFASILFLGFLYLVRDKLKEIDILNLRARLYKIEEIKKDVYAKAETVKKLAEEIAELTSFNISRVGRSAPPDLTEKILEARNKIKSVLEMIGSDKNKIENITSEINSTVLFDLKCDIVRKVRERILKSNPTEEATLCEKAVKIFPDGHKQYATLQIVCEDICKEVDDILKNYNLNSSRGALTQHLETNSVPTAEIIPLIDRLERFIKEKTI